MTDGLTVEYTDAASNRRRVRLEPRSVGGWDRYVDEFDGDRWRPVGHEIVADVTIEAAGDVVTEVGRA